MKKQVKELNLKDAKTLSGKGEIIEDSLKKIVERIKIFCHVSYQLYLKSRDKPTATVKKFESEPPKDFTNAA